MQKSAAATQQKKCAPFTRGRKRIKGQTVVLENQAVELQLSDATYVVLLRKGTSSERKTFHADKLKLVHRVNE